MGLLDVFRKKKETPVRVPKRKRRTRAEIEADNLKAASQELKGMEVRVALARRQKELELIEKGENVDEEDDDDSLSSAKKKVKEYRELEKIFGGGNKGGEGAVGALRALLDSVTGEKLAETIGPSIGVAIMRAIQQPTIIENEAQLTAVFDKPEVQTVQPVQPAPQAQPTTVGEMFVVALEGQSPEEAAQQLVSAAQANPGVASLIGDLCKLQEGQYIPFMEQRVLPQNPQLGAFVEWVKAREPWLNLTVDQLRLSHSTRQDYLPGSSGM